MSLTRFPTTEEALYLYGRLMEEFGGDPGVRDLGLLESALARPKSGYYTSLSEQAAALMHSLAMNQCFLDGNKRIAFALTAVFLRFNGYVLRVSPEVGEKFLIDRVIVKKVELSEITAWIEKYIVEI